MDPERAGSHVKMMEMLAVVLRGGNCRFWSHLVWSEQKVTLDVRRTQHNLGIPLVLGYPVALKGDFYRKHHTSAFSAPF